MPDQQPWYRTTLRWGQTNITELDPTRYDLDWWRRYWRRTRTQGIIVNAGGIVAYYPSRFPLQHRAEHLDGRDLFGEVTEAAREEGLVVLARMDSNRADAAFLEAHPDWFARHKDGSPYRVGDFFITCIHSPYYARYLPCVLQEIVDRYHPDGFTDNSWSGLSRDQICYCDHCARSFREATGHALPETVDWDDPVYRAWIKWGYRRRLEVWDLNNRTTREAGGPDCLWMGMNSGHLLHQSRSFRDTRAICERSEMVLLDSQTRSETTGFQANAQMGKLIHALLGWEKLIPESMAMYQSPMPTFRVASRPVPEARMWMVAGFAGTIQPWWHHVSAYHEDRRQYGTAAPLLQWHADHEAALVNREPVATVGVVWSQENLDFFGRSQPRERVLTPYWGAVQALIRDRIPYLPVHADHIVREAERLSLLILPNVGALSDSQCDAIRRFVADGGGVLASGASSLYDEDGEPRDDFALADLFGVSHTGEHHGTWGRSDTSWDAYAYHSYLRLKPELRAQVDGPQVGTEPPVTGQARHSVLDGFERTDLLPFGGRLERVAGVGGAGRETVVVPATWIPPFPIYPPEFAWMRELDSGLPALVLNAQAGRGRVGYMPAALDACYGRDHLPDHGRLLANLVRWAARDAIPLRVEGHGLVDCHLYRQGQRLVLHLVNLNHEGAWRSPLHALTPIGPLRVSVQVPEGMRLSEARCLVADAPVAMAREGRWATFDVASITDHEVVTLG